MYTVQDYTGAEETKGFVHCQPAGNKVELPINLRRGYHEVRFPELNSVFGVIALDRTNERVSDFFGLDTAFSYLERSADYRAQFVGQLSRLGIGTVRDRITWNELNPATEGWSGHGQHQFDELRHLYAKAGIKVVDVLQGLPENPVGYFPSSESSVATVSQIAAHWGKVWSGVEVANEPDHNRTYDKLSSEEKRVYEQQYASYASFASKDIKKVAPSVPIVGGAFAFALAGDKLDSSGFADGVAGVGLLRFVDAISFHTYVKAKTLQRDIDSFRRWLHRSGAPDMPLWITEAGWSWKRGPERPPLDQDQASALQIAAKAVVAYAMGVKRYYPFVYPYYEEKEKNFGMTGKERTPLRSLAAYEQVAKALSGARALTSIGDLAGGGSGVLLETPKGAVMVMFEGEARSGQSSFNLPFPVLKAEGIDGRPLQVANGQLSLADGLTYVWLAERDVPKAKEMLEKAR
ncbi:hypothetical protein [Dyella sp. EPa41]|uniref:hypothetical protein n=1 Tax=Dyella sp. EPa41 TaxID=1561194 RepID=UPI0019150391|nr:hypothetical protein [Dyella sp. EPa41]